MIRTNETLPKLNLARRVEEQRCYNAGYVITEEQFVVVQMLLQVDASAMCVTSNGGFSRSVNSFEFKVRALDYTAHDVNHDRLSERNI